MHLLMSKELPVDNVESTVLPPSEGMLLRVASRLHIWPVQDTDAGRYQCVASNQLGSTYSTRAVVTVNGMLLVISKLLRYIQCRDMQILTAADCRGQH